MHNSAEEVELFFRATACFRRDNGRWRMAAAPNAQSPLTSSGDKSTSANTVTRHAGCCFNRGDREAALDDGRGDDHHRSQDDLDDQRGLPKCALKPHAVRNAVQGGARD
jgi:hypothetical protein